MSTEVDRYKKRRKNHKDVRLESLKKRGSRDLDYLCKDAHCVIEYIIPYSKIEELIEE
ncbi:MAG: hypothetical protein ACP5GI_03445 [Sulfolobales archaeon]